MIKRRETELDLLRIIALIAVILVHSIGALEIQFNNNIGNSNNIIIFINAIVTWQVPVYVMISGRFFLDPKREMTFHKIRKAICRLIIAFVVWNVIYQAYYILFGIYSDLNIKGIIVQFIQGPYHFWYLYMLIFLYIIVPFLRKIVESKKLMELFILLFLTFEFITLCGVDIPYVGETISYVSERMNFHFALGYSGYYMLGYYLYKYKLSKKIEILLYAVAIVLLIGLGFITLYRHSIVCSDPNKFTRYLMPNIALEASAVYVLFTKRISKHKFSDKSVKIITKLSELSFGAYLVHAIVNEFLVYIPFRFDNPLIMWAIDILIVFIVSNVIVWLLRLIPYIGKKIT